MKQSDRMWLHGAPVFFSDNGSNNLSLGHVIAHAIILVQLLIVQKSGLWVLLIVSKIG